MKETTIGGEAEQRIRNSKKEIWQPAQNLEFNPALKDLSLLVGKWKMALSNASFLNDPSAVIEGQASFQWVEGGACLVMRQGKKPGDPFYASWLISRDEKVDNYSISYFDSRGVSRIYEMSFKGNLWKYGAIPRVFLSASRER